MGYTEYQIFEHHQIISERVQAGLRSSHILKQSSIVIFEAYLLRMTGIINALKRDDHMLNHSKGKKNVILVAKVTSESKWNGFMVDIILFIWQNHHITGYLITHQKYQKITYLESSG